MVIAGIDPGEKGAIAVQFDNGKIEVSKIFNKDITAQNSFLDIIWRVANGSMVGIEHTKVYLEKVNGIPKWGYKNFNYGRNYGHTKGILEILIYLFGSLCLEHVHPKTWQKSVYDAGCIAKSVSVKGLTDKEKNKAERIRYKAKKATNMSLAKRLFPKFGYLLDKKCNDGIADALLIMEYGRREMGLEHTKGIGPDADDVAQDAIFL